MDRETKTASNYLWKYIMLECNFKTQRYLEQSLIYTINFKENI